MKEEYEHYKTIRVIEYGMVIVILLIVLIILLPSVITITNNMAEDSAVTSTKNIVDSIKAIYTNMNLKNEVALPFEVVFEKDDYTFYEMGKKVNYEITLNIKIDGQLPTSGSILINKDGTTTVKDLTFGSIKCNQKNDQNLICTKNNN